MVTSVTGQTGAALDATRVGAVRTAGLVREMPPLAVIILTLLFTIAIFADLIAPHNPTLPLDDTSFFAPPVWLEGGSWNAILGTDFQNRDGFNRLIHGIRVSIIVGLVGTLAAGAIGATMGVLSGYMGRWVDTVIMRFTDAWLVLPALIFAIFLAVLVGPSMWNIVIILGAVFWTRYARVIRGEVLTLREREFVRLAEVAGASKPRVMIRHIMPNVMKRPCLLATTIL